MYRELLRYVEPDGMRTNYSGGGGTYPNLFDAHPPFQIDGNFGGAAAVLEMLVQSTENEIFILPALPDAWSEGSVNGICTRNGFEISMEWKDKTLTRLIIHSEKGGKAVLKYGDKQKKISIREGQSKEVFISKTDK
jgi:alpha-L-fucosidase 2